MERCPLRIGESQGHPLLLAHWRISRCSGSTRIRFLYSTPFENAKVFALCNLGTCRFGPSAPVLSEPLNDAKVPSLGGPRANIGVPEIEVFRCCPPKQGGMSFFGGTGTEIPSSVLTFALGNHFPERAAERHVGGFST